MKRSMFTRAKADENTPPDITSYIQTTNKITTF